MADLPVVAIEKAGRTEPPRDHNGDSGNDTTALGEKSKIQKVVDTLHGIVDYLESSESHLCPASDIKMTVSMQRVQDLQALAQDHFYDVASSLSRANFVFFCKVNGADLVIRMLNCLLTHPWEGLCDELQSLERSCVSLCWSLTELCVMYNHVAIQPCLVDIVTRVASQTRAKFCPRCRSESVSQDKEIKYKALLALSNLIEGVSLCREEIARNEALIAHVTNAISSFVVSDTIDHKIVRAAVNVFMALAYSPETHQYLAKQNILDCIETLSTKYNSHHICYSRYMASTFLAMLATGSAARHLLSDEHLRSISVYLATFLKSVDLDQLYEYEEQFGMYWVTMEAHVRVAFTPLCPVNNPQQVSEVKQQDKYELLLYSIEVAIVGMQVITHRNLESDDVQDVILKEDLLDYFRCLPWYTDLPVQSKAKERAQHLLKNLENMLEQPPTLRNAAKAKLATMYGFEAVRHSRFPENMTTLV